MKYRKNEAFVDVIETVNLMMSKDGKLHRAWDVGAKLNIRCGIASRRGWTGHDEGVPQWNTGM